MARFEEAASLEVTSFDPVANKLVLEQYFKPLFGIEKDEKIVKSLSDQLVIKLDGIDRVLEMREFMAGNVSGGASFSFGGFWFLFPSLNFRSRNRILSCRQ